MTRTVIYEPSEKFLAHVKKLRLKAKAKYGYCEHRMRYAVTVITVYDYPFGSYKHSGCIGLCGWWQYNIKSKIESI